MQSLTGSHDRDTYSLVVLQSQLLCIHGPLWHVELLQHQGLVSDELGRIYMGINPLDVASAAWDMEISPIRSQWRSSWPYMCYVDAAYTNMAYTNASTTAAVCKSVWEASKHLKYACSSASPTGTMKIHKVITSCTSAMTAQCTCHKLCKCCDTPSLWQAAASAGTMSHHKVHRVTTQ